MSAPATIGARIRWTRQLHGISLRELAARLGVVFQTVQTWEYATNSMQVRTIEKIAGGIGCSPEWLAFGRVQGSDLQVIAGLREIESHGE